MDGTFTAPRTARAQPLRASARHGHGGAGRVRNYVRHLGAKVCAGLREEVVERAGVAHAILLLALPPTMPCNAMPRPLCLHGGRGGRGGRGGARRGEEGRGDKGGLAMSQSGGGEGPYEQLCVAAPVTSHAQPAASDSSAQPHVTGHLPNPHGRVCTRMRASMCARAIVCEHTCVLVCVRASKQEWMRACCVVCASECRACVRLSLQISVRCAGAQDKTPR